MQVNSHLMTLNRHKICLRDFECQIPARGNPFSRGEQILFKYIRLYAPAIGRAYVLKKKNIWSKHVFLFTCSHVFLIHPSKSVWVYDPYLPVNYLFSSKNALLAESNLRGIIY